MSVTSAGSVCPPCQPRPRPPAAEPLHPTSLCEFPRATRTHGPCVTCRPCCKAGKPEETQATGAWLAGGRPARARAVGACGCAQAHLRGCCAASAPRVSMPSFSSAWHRGTSSAPAGAHSPRAPLAFGLEFPHVPTCPEDTHSWLLIPREG